MGEIEDDGVDPCARLAEVARRLHHYELVRVRGFLSGGKEGRRIARQRATRDEAGSRTGR